MPPHRFLGPAVCACAAPEIGEDRDELFRPRSIFYVHQHGAHECIDCAVSSDTINTVLDEDTMSSGNRTRQIYETAFDCKIAKSDDDLDEVERITKHTLLMQLNNCNNKIDGTKIKENRKSKSQRLDGKRSKSCKSSTQHKTDTLGSGSTISQELENSNLNNINSANTVSTSQLPLRGYTPSPPSTAPLPVKFPGKHERYFMNSIKSAPNLPLTNPTAQHPRLKDLRISVKNPESNEGSMIESLYSTPRKIERPRSVVLESSRVLELKRHSKKHHQHGVSYSSTESMATSSSGGSMESLRSSTSEGNRSTSSSESHRSTSLSSHSSDSGPSLSYPLRAPVLIHSKLHILSPISDKSSQEPGSETSDINTRNNNSQKVSPDEITKLEETDNSKTRRRLIQNKNLLLIKGDEIQGSDSGISLQSRDDSKSRSAFQRFGLQKLGLTIDKVDNNSAVVLPQDLNDLPFDMPKLRRRKIIPQQVG